MVTEKEARQSVLRLLGRPADDPLRPWRLVEFPQGWIVREEQRSDSEDPMVGAATRVVERGSGRIVRFPSSVPPGRIIDHYPAVADFGRSEPLPS